MEYPVGLLALLRGEEAQRHLSGPLADRVDSHEPGYRLPGDPIEAGNLQAAVVLPTSIGERGEAVDLRAAERKLLAMGQQRADDRFRAGRGHSADCGRALSLGPDG